MEYKIEGKIYSSSSSTWSGIKAREAFILNTYRGHIGLGIFTSIVSESTTRGLSQFLAEAENF
jgi:hypothetical protein